MSGVNTWVLKAQIFALSTLLYEHTKSVFWEALLTPSVVNSRTKRIQFQSATANPSNHLQIAIKAKCLEFHCTRLKRNETSERIESQHCRLAAGSGLAKPGLETRTREPERRTCSGMPVGSTVSSILQCDYIKITQ